MIYHLYSAVFQTCDCRAMEGGWRVLIRRFPSLPLRASASSRRPTDPLTALTTSKKNSTSCSTTSSSTTPSRDSPWRGGPRHARDPSNTTRLSTSVSTSPTTWAPSATTSLETSLSVRTLKETSHSCPVSASNFN